VTFSEEYLAESSKVIAKLDRVVIEKMVRLLVELRQAGGRLFVLGVGGGAGHASHAVGDFRKIAGIEAYTAMDNVPELTARTNDEGWETVMAAWLEGCRIDSKDMLFIFSVGGGDLERNISPNLVRALETAKKVGAKVLGVVGRDGGYTAKVADACVVVPTVNPAHVTAHTESFQALVWHLLVSHPDLQVTGMKWETSTK
jgi:D-sedoheptulose 7-phosphate isomerase